MPPLTIGLLNVPGRFPTLTPEFGTWAEHLNDQGDHKVIPLDLNYKWWRHILSPEIVDDIITENIGFSALCSKLKLIVDGADFKITGVEAQNSLDELEHWAAFKNEETYIKTLSPIVEHLTALKKAKVGVEVSLQVGPEIEGLDYNSSQQLTSEAVNNKSFMSRTIRNVLSGLLGEVSSIPDVVFFKVTTPQTLLTAMITAYQLKQLAPECVAVLADHGYENFSLHPYLPELKKTNHLLNIFDAIVEHRNDAAMAVHSVISAVEKKRQVYGYISTSCLEQENTHSIDVAPLIPAPFFRSFTPERILAMRVSEGQCYWGKCTYCTQNSKFSNARVPGKSDLHMAIKRIRINIDAGYHYFQFSDEALSPAMLRALAMEIKQSGLKLRWACRSKIEHAFDENLFQLLSETGCYEILFGIESIVPRVQKIMGKYTQGLERSCIENIFQQAERCGIRLHINLIGGYPGETVEELAETKNFLLHIGQNLTHMTFLLNEFSLFQDTPMLLDPQAYGIRPLKEKGDMIFSVPYEYTNENQSRNIPLEREDLLTNLGWRRLGHDKVANTALHLYFTSGHGAMFKASNSFAFSHPMGTIDQMEEKKMKAI